LVTQSEQPPLRHLSYVMHVEDEGLEDDDVRSIPTVLGSHRYEKRQRPGRGIRSEVKPQYRLSSGAYVTTKQIDPTNAGKRLMPSPKSAIVGSAVV